MVDEYIRRKDAIRAFEADNQRLYYPFEVTNRLRTVPAADAAPVVHGRWLDISGVDHDSKLCSSCGIGVTGLLAKRCNYCPNCGAKMDGGEA